MTDSVSHVFNPVAVTFARKIARKLPEKFARKIAFTYTINSHSVFLGNKRNFNYRRNRELISTHKPVNKLYFSEEFSYRMLDSSQNIRLKLYQQISFKNLT